MNGIALTGEQKPLNDRQTIRASSPKLCRTCAVDVTNY